MRLMDSVEGEQPAADGTDPNASDKMLASQAPSTCPFAPRRCTSRLSVGGEQPAADGTDPNASDKMLAFQVG
ncbi:hypothetical protein T484DRAFT_1793119 [Baffinella frigidus]|nr:hypothetical protein T484DRAFT_1793119 [Cryptophyta sp. CCMP2293]